MGLIGTRMFPLSPVFDQAATGCQCNSTLVRNITERCNGGGRSATKALYLVAEIRHLPIAALRFAVIVQQIVCISREHLRFDKHVL